MPQYKGTEGELISIKDAKRFTCAYVDGKDTNHVEAEFFGLKTFEKLLKECGGDPVGFRVYYGVRNEDHSGLEPCECGEEVEGSKVTPRLIIVPVDANGTELTGLHSARAYTKNMDHEAGKKDMPEEGGRAMAFGPQCPGFC